MNRRVLLSSLLVSALLSAIFLALSGKPALADVSEAEPTYVGVAEYYDNRRSVVTSTNDDLAYNTSAWQSCLSMLTAKKIYHTVALITNASPWNDWGFVQYWLDEGYTEAGSHSRNHVHVPYTWYDYDGTPRISYEWQINGSKNDITGNLTLPGWWKCNEKEYVYAWVEPYGSYDDTVRQWLGETYYLSERSISKGMYDFAAWDSSKNVFQRVGCTVEMGNPPWGGDTSVSSLNGKFDTAYNNGKIYHLMTHPSHVIWSEGSYADQHLDYISNRTDVWYVPFGLLYLYRWVFVRNIVNVTSTDSGEGKIFELSISATNHFNYGVSYPMTYVFDLPSNWTSEDVYFRYREADPWVLMESRGSGDFFNGITASRVDFTNNRAYVSVGFSGISHKIYLRLGKNPFDVAAVSVASSKTVVGQGCSAFVNVTVENQGVYQETFNVTAYANSTEIGQEAVTLLGGCTVSVSVMWNTSDFAKGSYTISAYVPPLLGETDTADNLCTCGVVVVVMVGDVNADGRVNILDLAIMGVAYFSYPGHPQWNPNADLDNDGLIQIIDLAICARNYGKADS